MPKIHHLPLAILFSLAFLSVSYSPSALSQRPQSSEWNVKLGAGAISAFLPWKGADIKSTALPYFDVAKGNWSFGFRGLVRYRTVVADEWRVSLGLGYRDDGYSNDFGNDALFSGYGTPEGEFTADLEFAYDLLKVDFSQDISGNSESSALALGLKFPLYNNRKGFRVTAGTSVNWQSADYVNYYFGVSGQQINNAVRRVAYRGGAAVNYKVSLNVLYPLNRKWVLMGLLSRTELDDTIYNSPLIEQDYKGSVGMFVVYQM
jgi:outer membrane protein